MTWEGISTPDAPPAPERVLVPTYNYIPPLGLVRGYQQVVSLPQPAAGAGFTYQISGDSNERIVAVTFQLVTSAVVANRGPRLFYRDGDNANIICTSMSTSIAASTTAQVSFWIGWPQPSAQPGAFWLAPLPDFALQQGMQVFMNIANVDVGDQVSAIRILSQKLPVGPFGPDPIDQSYPT